VPTDQSTWGDIGIGAGIAAGAAMLLGSILGGIRGDRWHGRLATAVVEHREAVERDARDDEVERTRVQNAEVGTSVIDLRNDDRTELSVEEERDADVDDTRMGTPIL
jgi:hypothetical protein